MSVRELERVGTGTDFDKFHDSHVSAALSPALSLSLFAGL